jgi:hypothetical protein
MIKSNKIWYCLKALLAIVLLPAVFESCTAIVDVRPVDSDDGLQTVSFTVRTPYAATPKTYALDAVSENDIQTIDVLAFRVNNTTLVETYAYRAKGFEITNVSSSEKEFKVTLQKNDTIRYRLVFLANVRSELDAFAYIPGELRAQLMERLTSTNAGAWDVSAAYKPIPMWGQSANDIFISDAMSPMPGITLVRSIVSIEVYAGAVEAVFLLEDVTLYNRKTAGRVAPADANFDNVGKVATAPTLPTGAYSTFTGLLFSVPLISPRQSAKTIYTYEAAAVLPGEDYSATCIVIGGTYIPTGTKQYYRIDFDVRNNVTGDFESYKPLLRNHRYQFLLNSVIGDGHNTADLAFYGKKGQIGVEILTWNLGDLDGTVIKEEHRLSLSQSQMDVAGAGSYIGYVGVSTTHPGGWTAERENAGDTWIENVDGSHDNYMVITLAANPPAGGRTGYILVKAGNMVKRFKIVQHP